MIELRPGTGYAVIAPLSAPETGYDQEVPRASEHPTGDHAEADQKHEVGEEPIHRMASFPAAFMRPSETPRNVPLLPPARRRRDSQSGFGQGRTRPTGPPAFAESGPRRRHGRRVDRMHCRRALV